MSLLATILLTSDAATSTMNRSGKPGAVHNPDGRVFKRQSPKFGPRVQDRPASQRDLRSLFGSVRFWQTPMGDASLMIKLCSAARF